MGNAIGNVGGLTAVISVTPVVQAAAYATGDVIGGKMTITNALLSAGGSGILQSVQVCSKSDLTVDLDLIIFSADPATTTFTENGAVAIDVVDVSKVLAVIPITTRKDLGTPVVAYANNLAIPVQGDAANLTRHLYASLVARGAYTPASTSDVTVRFGLLQDQ